MPKRSMSYVVAGGVVEAQRNKAVPTKHISTAVSRTNHVFEELSSVVPYVYDLLQMRNLSAFVGAAFCRELANSSEGLLRLNPHQDGYPDLLLMDDEGRKLWTQLDGKRREKEPFSPFASGGIEVKATCGDVPSARALTAKGTTKPDIGDTRIDLVKSLNWKAHHRGTNYLIALLWDFVDTIPAIVAVMYSNNLSELDWGKIVRPKDDGGRTTSVSIMNRQGVKKLASNPILVVNDKRYKILLDKFS